MPWDGIKGMLHKPSFGMVFNMAAHGGAGVGGGGSV